MSALHKQARRIRATCAFTPLLILLAPSPGHACSRDAGVGPETYWPAVSSTVPTDFVGLVRYADAPAGSTTTALVRPDQTRITGTSTVYSGAIGAGGLLPYWLVFGPVPASPGAPYHLEVGGRLLGPFAISDTRTSTAGTRPPRAPLVSEMRSPASCAACSSSSCDNTWGCNSHRLVIADLEAPPLPGQLWLLEVTECPAADAMCRLGPQIASDTARLPLRADEVSTAGRWCFAARSIGAPGASPLSPATCITLEPVPSMRCSDPPAGVDASAPAAADSSPAADASSTADAGIAADASSTTDGGGSCTCMYAQTDERSVSWVVIAACLALARVRRRAT